MTVTQQELEESLYQQLKGVDTHARRNREWLAEVIACLVDNGFESRC